MTSPETLQPWFSEIGVVGLVPDRWEPQWQARHHVLSRLARYFQVVWLDEPTEWRRRCSLREVVTRPLAEDAQHPSLLQVYDPGFWFTPARFGDWFLRKRLQRARNLLLSHGCRQIVLSIWRPDFAAALGQIAHDLSCYHIDDEYSFSATERELDEREKHLIQAVGQVFIHSPALMEKKGHLNPHTEFISNGVDYPAFARPVPEPEDLRHIPRPRIGYAGVLKAQLDWRLLLELSARHPQWSFVFVGQINPYADPGDPLRAMAARRNVYLLGTKSTAELVQYPQHFDVCIMPYCMNAYTRYIYPLKLHEYLASGTPVVTSPIRSVLSFSGVVALAESAEEWARALGQALSPGATAASERERRQAVARAHDWEILVRRMAQVIMERFGPLARSRWDALPPGFPAISRKPEACDPELRNKCYSS